MLNKISDIKLAKKFHADCVELHTGNFCNLFNKKKTFNKSFLKLKNAAKFGHKIGIDVHAGHGLTFESIKHISKIKEITEFNIGHYIIANSLFIGLSKAIKEIKMVLNK